MGKSKNKRLKLSRPTGPTGLPSVKDTEEEILEENHSADGVQSLLERLQSPNTEDRECASFEIAGLADDPKSVQSLLEEEIVRTAAPLLIDRVAAVRHAVAGALRNLSAVGHEACSVMLDQDVMTPLIALLKQYEPDWQPTGSKNDPKSAVLKEAVHLLWNICESGERPVALFNRDNLHAHLYPLLNVEKYGSALAIPAAHCLHTMTEDNPELISKIKDFQLLNSLVEEKSSDPDNLLLKVLAAGILLNIYQLNQSPSFVPQITAADEALSVQVLEHFSQLASLIRETTKLERKKNKDPEEIEEKESKIRSLCGDLCNTLAAKQIALEILANLCCSEDNENVEEDSSDSAEDSFNVSMDDEDTSVVFPLTVPCDVQDALINRNIVSKVRDHFSGLDESMEYVFQDHKLSTGILKLVHTVRCRALLCIDNLAQSLDPGCFGDCSGLATTWEHLFQLILKSSKEKDLELLEASVSAGRGVLQALARAKEKESDYSLPCLSRDQIVVLSQVCSSCSESSVRMNICRIVGIFGCLWNDQQELVKGAGEFLLEFCSKDPELIVVAEALDVIFDVFAEDDTDPIAVEIGLVPKLKQILPMFKGKIGQNKKSVGKHYPVIMTAKNNLMRFLKYKASQNGSHCK